MRRKQNNETLTKCFIIQHVKTDTPENILREFSNDLVLDM